MRGENVAKTIAVLAADDISARNYRLLQTRFTTIARETNLRYIALVRVSDGRALVHTNPDMTAKKLEGKEDQAAASTQTILKQNLQDKKIVDVALPLRTVSEWFVIRVGVPYNIP